MNAILKTLFSVVNDNRRKKVLTVIKELKMREYSVHTDFSLNCYVLVILDSPLPPSLTSCIQNVVDIFRDAVDVELEKYNRLQDNISKEEIIFLGQK